MSVSAGRQRGIAAIEFASVFVALFMAFYGLASLGAVLYTQQAITRSAEDGARAIALLPSGALPDIQRVRDTVHDSLASSLVVPLAFSTNGTSRRAWIAAHVEVAVATAATNAATVDVRYRYSDNRLLPSMAVLDTSRWLPDVLIGRATLAQPA